MLKTKQIESLFWFESHLQSNDSWIGMLVQIFAVVLVFVLLWCQRNRHFNSPVGAMHRIVFLTCCRAAEFTLRFVSWGLRCGICFDKMRITSRSTHWGIPPYGFTLDDIPNSQVAAADRPWMHESKFWCTVPKRMRLQLSTSNELRSATFSPSFCC